jgi:hypothetical protein
MCLGGDLRRGFALLPYPVASRRLPTQLAHRSAKLRPHARRARCPLGLPSPGRLVHHDPRSRRRPLPGPSPSGRTRVINGR